MSARRIILTPEDIYLFIYFYRVCGNFVNAAGGFVPNYFNSADSPIEFSIGLMLL